MIVGLVLAAGESKRMGINKLLLPLRGQPIILLTLSNWTASPVDQVMLVVGHERESLVEAIEEKIEGWGSRVLLVTNDNFMEGMSSSIVKGIGGLKGEVEAALIALGDQPFIGPEIISQVISGFRRGGKRIVVPVYGETRGHPVLFERSLFPELLALKGDMGAKELLARHPDQVWEEAVNSPGILTDIDLPQDYRDASAEGNEEKKFEGP